LIQKTVEDKKDVEARIKRAQSKIDAAKHRKSKYAQKEKKEKKKARAMTKAYAKRLDKKVTKLVQKIHKIKEEIRQATSHKDRKMLRAKLEKTRFKLVVTEKRASKNAHNVERRAEKKLRSTEKKLKKQAAKISELKTRMAKTKDPIKILKIQKEDREKHKLSKISLKES
jgi:hypothetical protein